MSQESAEPEVTRLIPMRAHNARTHAGLWSACPVGRSAPVLERCRIRGVNIILRIIAITPFIVVAAGPISRALLSQHITTVFTSMTSINSITSHHCYRFAQFWP